MYIYFDGRGCDGAENSYTYEVNQIKYLRNIYSRRIQELLLYLCYLVFFLPYNSRNRISAFMIISSAHSSFYRFDLRLDTCERDKMREQSKIDRH